MTCLRATLLLVLATTYACAEPTAGALDIALGFERNVGQTDARVRFLAHTNGFQFFLTSSDAVMAIAGARGTMSSVRMRLEGSNPQAKIRAVDPMAGSTNYFIGRQHHTNIPRFGGVRYERVYPGIDLVYRVHGGDIEFDFDVAPGADARKIELAFTGAKSLALDESGDLLIHTATGTVHQRRARVYQGLPETGTRLNAITGW